MSNSFILLRVCLYFSVITKTKPLSLFLTLFAEHRGEINILKNTYVGM